MRNLIKSLRFPAAFLGLLIAGTGIAQAVPKPPPQQSCAITGSATASPAVYDPFNPTGLATTNITLHLVRANDTGGGTTSVVNFYLHAGALTGTGADGSVIIPTSVSGQANIDGIGLNVFYNYNAAAPTLTPISLLPTGSNRFLKISFTGNNAASNSVDVNFQVSLPPNLDLTAVQELAFDAIYFCNIQGGTSNGETQFGTAPNAVKFPVTVLSALRTYYAGTALDFGEIGQITTASLSGTPRKTGTSNYVFVQSSGAYSVTLSSLNGYLLKKPGAAGGNDQVAYRLRFLGYDRDSSSGAPNSVTITRSCQRATLSTAGNVLPIQAKLLEGGTTKNPSPSYSDQLTVTVTPLIYSDQGTDSCGTFGLAGF